MKRYLLIGNSDGIGLTLTKLLIDEGHTCVGVSRSNLELDSSSYQHHIFDVSNRDYCGFIASLIEESEDFDACIFLVGIGNPLDWNNLAEQEEVMQVNLMSAVQTTQAYLKNGKGHMIGLSSVADLLILPDSPSYSASKSALSKYWEALHLGRQSKDVFVSNIRFGFVNTKMASSPIKPFMLTTNQAAAIIYNVIKKPKVRLTTPKLILPFVYLYKFVIWVKLKF